MICSLVVSGDGVESRLSSSPLLERLLVYVGFPIVRKEKAAPPRATLTTVALGSPAFLVQIRTGSATFCPFLAAGLAFQY